MGSGPTGTPGGTNGMDGTAGVGSVDGEKAVIVVGWAFVTEFDELVVEVIVVVAIVVAVVVVVVVVGAFVCICCCCICRS